MYTDFYVLVLCWFWVKEYKQSLYQMPTIIIVFEDREVHKEETLFQVLF